MSRLLIVEDEQHLADGLRFNLEAEGYDVEVVDTGELALARLEQPPPIDLAILDVMLPGMSGFAVTTELRKRGQFVPVLMLTARGRAADVLQGFAAGADDYLPKPFELAILLARINGLLRRRAWMAEAAQAAPAPPARLAVGGRVIDFETLEVRQGDRTMPLTAMEAKLLRYLVENEGRTVSRKAILEDVWEVHEDTDTRAIDNFIVRLRRYLEDDPTSPQFLLTVRGVGYRFTTGTGRVRQPQSS
ncbi:MAG TPA: response regulator transcription factor [Vicinamibacterales bacterium]|nr:response regulator transcription factor [Vicinamibacterales bacterium]